jgi:aryl carrier-like protein
MVANGVEVPFTFRQPLWQHTQYAHVEHSMKSQAVLTEPHVKASIETAETIVEAIIVATDALRKRVSTLLSMPQERLLEGSAMQLYGIDSLVATELRNWLRKTFGVDIAVFEIVGGASFIALGTSIAIRIREEVS